MSKKGRKVAKRVDDGKTAKFWLGAVAGIVAGTVAGIMIAPKSGEDTRRDLGAARCKAKRGLRDKWRAFRDRKKPKETKRLTAGKILEEAKEAEVKETKTSKKSKSTKSSKKK